LDVEESSLYYLVKEGERLSRRFEEAVSKTYDRILESPLAGAPREFLSPELSGLRMWPVGGFEKHLDAPVTQNRLQPVASLAAWAAGVKEGNAEPR